MSLQEITVVRDGNSRAPGQLRRWCFTINNPHSLLLPIDFEIEPQVRFAVFQLEQGEQTGTIHYQGYVEFITPWRRNRVVNWLNEKAGYPSVYGAGGSREQNITYCTKIETRYNDPGAGPFVVGDPDQDDQGKRNDITELQQMIVDGASDKEIFYEIPRAIFQWSKGINAARLAIADRRDWKTEVFLCFGEPGTGKSRWAMDNFPNAFWKMPNCEWWDGYLGHETVVMDDFDGKWLKPAVLKQIMDRYPCNVEIKV